MLPASEPRQHQRQENLSNSSAGSVRLPCAAGGSRPPPPHLQESWPCPGWKAKPSRTAREVPQALGDKHVLQRRHPVWMSSHFLRHLPDASRSSGAGLPWEALGHPTHPATNSLSRLRDWCPEAGLFSDLAWASETVACGVNSDLTARQSRHLVRIPRPYPEVSKTLSGFASFQLLVSQETVNDAEEQASFMFVALLFSFCFGLPTEAGACPLYPCARGPRCPAPPGLERFAHELASFYQPRFRVSPSPALRSGAKGRERCRRAGGGGGSWSEEGAGSSRLRDGVHGMSRCSWDPAAGRGERGAAEVLSVAAVPACRVLPQPHIPWALRGQLPIHRACFSTNRTFKELGAFLGFFLFFFFYALLKK